MSEKAAYDAALEVMDSSPKGSKNYKIAKTAAFLNYNDAYGAGCAWTK